MLFLTGWEINCKFFTYCLHLVTRVAKTRERSYFSSFLMLAFLCFPCCTSRFVFFIGVSTELKCYLRRSCMVKTEYCLAWQHKLSIHTFLAQFFLVTCEHLSMLTIVPTQEHHYLIVLTNAIIPPHTELQSSIWCRKTDQS